MLIRSVEQIGSVTGIGNRGDILRLLYHDCFRIKNTPGIYETPGVFFISVAQL